MLWKKGAGRRPPKKIDSARASGPLLKVDHWHALKVASSPQKGRNRANAPKKRELVVHFQEWATSFQEKGSNQANAPKRQELVVHF